MDDSFAEHHRKYFKKDYDAKEQEEKKSFDSFLKELTFLQLDAEYKIKLEKYLDSLPWWRDMPVWRQPLRTWLRGIQIFELFLKDEVCLIRDDTVINTRNIRYIDTDRERFGSSAKKYFDDRCCDGVTFSLGHSSDGDEQFFYNFKTIFKDPRLSRRLYIHRKGVGTEETTGCYENLIVLRAALNLEMVPFNVWLSVLSVLAYPIDSLSAVHLDASFIPATKKGARKDCVYLVKEVYNQKIFVNFVPMEPYPGWYMVDSSVSASLLPARDVDDSWLPTEICEQITKEYLKSQILKFSLLFTDAQTRKSIERFVLRFFYLHNNGCGMRQQFSLNLSDAKKFPNKTTTCNKECACPYRSSKLVDMPWLEELEKFISTIWVNLAVGFDGEDWTTKLQLADLFHVPELEPPEVKKLFQGVAELKLAISSADEISRTLPVVVIDIIVEYARDLFQPLRSTTFCPPA